MPNNTEPKPRIYVYILEDPFTREWRYLGKTSQLAVRFKNHCNEKTNTHRSHWIQSIIRRGGKPRMKIIMEVPVWADWREAERAWIDFAYRSGWPLVNGTYGGDGVDATPEIREKISRANRGRKLSPEHRARAAKQLASLPRLKQLPESWRQAISRGRTGLKFTTEHCRQISEGKRKITRDQITDILRRIESGESQSSVAKSFGVAQPTISAIKNSRRKYSEASCS